MSKWKNPEGCISSHGAPGNGKLIRPRGRVGSWRGESPSVLKEPFAGRPRQAVIALAKANKAWSRARTEMNKRIRIGDPEVQPPPLAKPASPGSYGECPDEQDVPWHKRSKRRQS